jgi:MBG domain (YGX type)
MKKLLWLCLVAVAPAFAQNYTITAPHLTMHVGDPVPPCPILVINQSTGLSVGEGNTVFAGSGYASCTIGATSTSPVGTYAITVSGGAITPKSGEVEPDLQHGI